MMAMPTAVPKIAFLGTGLMGWPMARRLCDAGHPLNAWNRSPEKAERLRPYGAAIAATPAGATANADIVITMLENGPTVAQVLFDQGAAAAMRPGTLLVDMSSIKPAEARDHAGRLAALGLGQIDAPVSGGTNGAEAGTLAIMAGGAAADVERVRPVLASMGRVVHVGPTGAGQLAKLANQMIVGITIGAVAEALLLAARGGADMARVREAIRGGFAESRVLEVHGQRMVDGDLAKRAAMTVQLKDMRNALDAAAGLGFAAPITKLLAELYADGVHHGLADLDHSALFVELARRSAGADASAA